jgi:hypothetical protein
MPSRLTDFDPGEELRRMMEEHSRVSFARSSGRVQYQWAQEYTDAILPSVSTSKAELKAMLQKQKAPSPKLSKEELAKFNPDKRTEAELTSDGISIIAACVREELLNYFKDGMVARVASRGGMGYASLSPTRADVSYFYERRERDNHREAHLKLALFGLSVARLSREPDEMTINVKIEKRSAEMQRLYDEIRRFLAKYLQGVRVIEIETRVAAGTKTAGKCDKELFATVARKAAPSLEELALRGQEFEAAYFDEYATAEDVDLSDILF